MDEYEIYFPTSALSHFEVFFYYVVAKTEVDVLVAEVPLFR